MEANNPLALTTYTVNFNDGRAGESTWPSPQAAAAHVRATMNWRRCYLHASAAEPDTLLCSALPTMAAEAAIAWRREAKEA